MSPTTRTEERQATTPDEIRVMLQKTDWEDYTRRVVEEVAKKAEEYKEANAKSLEGASRHVFV